MPKLESKQPLVFVTATRNKGTSRKTGNDYDMASIEVSDGIASLELPLKPDVTESILNTFRRGDKVQVVVDVDKRFGKAAFEVVEVQPIK